MTLVELIPLLEQLAPEIISLVGQIVQAIKDNKAGLLTAQQAEDAAQTALAQLLGRQADPAAQDASDLASVTAEMEAKAAATPAKAEEPAK